MEPNHATSERVSTDAALASVLALREIDARSRAFVPSSVYHQGPGLLAAPTGWDHELTDMANPPAAPALGPGEQRRRS
jgi:hypothetical protein